MELSPRTTVAVVLAVAAVAGGLLALDFEAASYETTASATAASGGANVDSLPPVTDGTLVVDAPEAVRDDLTAALVESFAERGVTLEPADARDEDVDGPVVVVVVDEWDSHWNPVAPVGSVAWRAAFDAGGHARHVDAALSGDALVFESTDGPDLAGSVEASVDSAGTGVVSRPAYRAHLVGVVADATAEQVVGQFSQR
ncbi:hypothetical protein [Haloferax gibbonsii]|uniref:Uncharacterized protein n=1 Tax=Haloferax gibbonsii TaxID=35746 RepID=A0A0K1IVZ6_HALGI|nr:hypothetical protein [Haloferax gibbonsii]AKU08495.1 hypothetical protein ABY42_12400 [Haloferax gibbonsii]